MTKKDFTVTNDLIASKNQRFANYLIDLVLQYGIGFLIGVIAFLLADFTGIYAFYEWIETMGTVEEYLLGFAILLVYYFTSEALSARTLGKFVTGTIVVMEDGSKPDKMTILRRTFCRLIPLNHLSFLKAPARGWHDSISDTYVVDKKRFEDSRNLHDAFEEIGIQPEFA